jgi:exo-1,4-beta-D-glucosaminidase
MHMKKDLLFRTLLVLASAATSGLATVPGESKDNPKLMLRENWAIQSSAKVQAGGEMLSTIQFTPKGWYATAVPTTVLNALIENKIYPDPYFGMHLRSIPGTQYPIGENFSNLPMPPDSPFRLPWWYRLVFQLPLNYRGKTVWLHFDAINFRANIWLNGRLIADSSTVVGAFRFHEFDITGFAKPGTANVLAVEVFPAQANDLGITWVDVNPAPPDKDMGIWHEVYVTPSGPVALRHPQVISHLDLPSLDVAHLTVSAELYNASGHPVRGVLAGQIENIDFRQEVELGAQERKRVTFSPKQFAQLTLSHPRLWWPWQMGTQNLYTLKIEFRTNGEFSDSQEVHFGIRDVSSELTAERYRLFRINGQKILIRGAGWWSDMLLRPSPERQEAEIRYARDMHLNCLRMDGKLEDDNFLDLADRYGLLLMPGWCCCDHWEKWQSWKAEDYTIAVESLRDHLRRFRNHPSILSWLNGDDNPPPEKVAQLYVKVLKEENWPNPYQASATGKPAAVTGETGLKMTGPYEWVPPAYWLTDKQHGGAFGFITETSPGPAIPAIEGLREFIPADHLWPIDEYWDFHAGGGVFKNIKVYLRALNARYGEATGMEDFAKKAQVMDYEGERAMFEAYGRNKYLATGVLRQMLNNAWPSLVWVLYDYYLRPAGSYFGAKKACEPLHVQYSYDDRSIVVVNSYYRAFKGMKVTAKVYNLDLSERFSKQATVDVPPDSANTVFTIPAIEGLTTTYFIRLVLEDSESKVVSRNFYWLSTKPDVLDWEKTVWYYTPTKSFADLTALRTLPEVELKGSSTTEVEGDGIVTRVKVENPSNNLAFFIHMLVTQGQRGQDVLPILWEDNYFELMPGEERELRATYARKDLQGRTPIVEIDGWNVLRATLVSNVLGGQRIALHG